MKDYTKVILIGLILGVFMILSYNIVRSNIMATESNLMVVKEISKLRAQFESTEMEYHTMKTEVQELLDILGVGEISPQEPMGYSQMEIITLATMIDNEARNQPYLGKVAVGAVIMNRVKSERFPDRIHEVVLTPGQFAKLHYIGDQLLPESLKAAKDALKGYDPTGGALFFYNPSTASCQWITTRPTVIKIADHVFAR